MASLDTIAACAVLTSAGHHFNDSDIEGGEQGTETFC